MKTLETHNGLPSQSGHNGQAATAVISPESLKRSKAGVETQIVRDYWEQASCGTDRTERPKHSLEYFEEIEKFRYDHEPYIHSFAQFTRWRGKDVLEVGVGAGTDFLQWARAGANAHGVDLTLEAVENVQQRLSVYGLAAKSLVNCNAEQIPHKSNSFDLVYSWGVIHHAENMEKVFDEIYRVVKPGGTIKIMVYNIRSMHSWYMYVQYGLLAGKPFSSRAKAIYEHQESYATKAYSEKQIKQLLSRYAHSNLRFSYWDQLIRTGAKAERTRRALQSLVPAGRRWYMAFEFNKEVN